MSDYTDFDAWKRQCLDLGFEGPYKIHGRLMWQFVSDSGTAALFNLEKNKGYIFGEFEGSTDSANEKP
jgi:hypothetical protein